LMTIQYQTPNHTTVISHKRYQLFPLSVITAVAKRLEVLLYKGILGVAQHTVI